MVGFGQFWLLASKGEASGELGILESPERFGQLWLLASQGEATGDLGILESAKPCQLSSISYNP
jgi:hypothetical protein